MIDHFSASSKIRSLFLILLTPLVLAQASPSAAQDAQETNAATADEVSPAEEATSIEDAADGRVTSPQISTAELSHLLVPLTKSELEDVSRTWFDTVRSKTREIAELQAERARNPQEGDDPRIARIVELVEERARLLERFTLALESLERKGGDEALVAELKAYRSSILYEETALASTRALVGSFFVWLGRRDGGLAVLQSVLIAVLALAGIVLAARFVRGFARMWIKRFTNISKLLQGFIVGAIFWIFILVGLVVVLSSVNVDITPLFAVIGGASFILAFAFQDTLGNLASGLMIMINQPFDEGDFIEVGGVGGTVKNVSIVGTTIATPDNKIIVVPNKNVWGNVIVNATASDTRRVDLVFSASYDDPIQDVLDVITQEVANHSKVLSEPAADIRATDLAASSVDFVCRPWVKAEDYWDVKTDLTRRVKEAFEREGLSMPYPQQDVHLKGQAPA
ncbi:small conductance mechanosensitive channel [Altererythrobacter ishigakiensis]|uniref:Small-conductance mechanosensitive channel n=1 Tax=Altererythrobacter ishigakiensis TaxID=476157 RepID=A0A562UUH0_9SPHN|nr:small conductance mechanosensitive channel [Altererythrobacter ishigakiensis]